jgi:ABC-type transport system involved in multi-copper enzyme maturation permease subunit
MSVVLTVAGLTLREAARRKVLRALGALTVILLGLSAWGFAKLASVEVNGAGLTSGEARLAGSEVLNLVMFGYSLVAALGTAFLAGPTLAGEIESGMALAVLARPVRRSTVLLGKWLGLVAFGAGFVAVAGFAQFVVVRVTVGYWPPDPVVGLLLSTVISPMASGIVAVGLFGATWVAGVVGNVGVAINNDSVAEVGTVSRVLLPTDGLWRGAMHAFQDPSALGAFGDVQASAFPFLSQSTLSAAYLGWVAVWVLMIGGLAALAFARRDV